MDLAGAEQVNPAVGGPWALAAAVVTSAAWYMANRRTRVDRGNNDRLAGAEEEQAAAALVEAATDLATTALAELAELKSQASAAIGELDAVRERVEVLSSQLADCEERHVRTEQALQAAGIILAP